MIRNSRRVAALAVAGAVAIAPVISGCGAGMTPESTAPTQLADGINAAVPAEGPTQISLRNMFLLGPEPGKPVPTGSSLALYGFMVNQVEGQGDELTAVSSPQFGNVRIEGGSLPLPPAQPDGEGGMTRLLGQGGPTPTRSPNLNPGDASETPTAAITGPGSTASPTESPTSQNTLEAPLTETPPPPDGRGTRPLVVLEGLKKDLLAGALVPVRLQFKNAGAVELQIPVVPHQPPYKTYPLATPPASPQQPGTSTPSPGGTQPTGTATPGTETPGGTATPGTETGAAGGQ